jgi:hypothetical protein
MTVSISDSQHNSIKCQYAGRRYAECGYSECRGATKSYVELDTDPGISIYTKGLTG